MNVNSSDIPTLPKHLRAAIERAKDKLDLSEHVPNARPWSNAKPTEEDGIKFPSRTEARVFARLVAELKPDERLFRQVRLPLLSLGPRKGDRKPESYLTIDFAVTRGGKLVRLIDAKCSGRVSRDWKGRAAACRETWGIEIEEVER